VNANEDLLLNGQREPTHRGVCQHLLAKVDKTKVLQASERVTPQEATQLLAGVLRFSSDLAYIVRFLECVKAAQGGEQATRGLTHALGQIDFDDASSAQVRQILALIVEVFPARELPVFLFSLLRSAPFRKAFDRSREGLPESLSSMLLPLRAVHQLASGAGRSGRGRRRRGSPDRALLSEGALLLMRVNRKSLLEFSEPVRHRLFEILCDVAEAQNDAPKGALLELFGSLKFADAQARATALDDFVALLLRLGLEREVRTLLEPLRKSKDAIQVRTSERWLALLQQPKVGPIALEPVKGRRDAEEAPKRTKSEPERPSLPRGGRWYRGVLLESQKSVRALWPEKEGESDFSRSVEAWENLLLPRIARPVAANTSQQAGPLFVAVELYAQGLKRELGRGSSSLFQSQLCSIFEIVNALSGAGLGLPGPWLERFSLDEGGGIWLSDLIGLKAASGDAPSGAEAIRQLLAEVESVRPSFSLDEQERSAVAAAPSVLDVARALDLL
jgi:hypothetical protein